MKAGATRHRGRAAVEVVFTDHGPGVPRGERSRIFEPFHRARRDAHGPKSGLGLGLALARGLARGLGGNLECQRPEESGAAFRLVIPAADTKQTAK
jgi:signal transduction histidine kinase